MRIFVLGAGATGSLLAELLERQGHSVWCGDRDPARARRFLGKRSTIAVTEVNARNLRGIARAARGCQLIVNASASVFNQIVMRAALRMRAHYVDLSSHLTRNPFKAEQFSYAKRFEEKNRTALINAGAAPGLTNLLVKRAAEMLDEVHSVQIRLYESTESDDPISQWSPEVSFDEAISSPRVYREGKFRMEKRFAELEKFRFPDPIGHANVVLAAQDEVATLPYAIPMRDMDVKIGGNEFDRLRRWYKQGKLSKSRGIVRDRFPQTSSPRAIAKLIRAAERAVFRLGAGTRHEAWPETRSAVADSHRRHVPDALSNPPARPLYDSRRVCHGSRRRALHQEFSARRSGCVRPGSAAGRNAARDHRRDPRSQRKDHAQNNDHQAKR
jgi:Saccharopine dehydrogenase NADP binding domain